MYANYFSVIRLFVDPMGLPQETIEQCLRYKTEIASRINRIDGQIRDWTKDLDAVSRFQPTARTVA